MVERYSTGEDWALLGMREGGEEKAIMQPQPNVIGLGGRGVGGEGGKGFEEIEFTLRFELMCPFSFSSCFLGGIIQIVWD